MELIFYFLPGDRTPCRREHLAFDSFLAEKKVISGDADGNTVHSRMDRDANKHGPCHQDVDYWHSPEGIRDMVNTFRHSIGISNQTATDFIRIAYGHMCLDCMYGYVSGDKSKNSKIDWNELYKETYKCFRRHGHHRRYFRESKK